MLHSAIKVKLFHLNHLDRTFVISSSNPSGSFTAFTFPLLLSGIS